MLALKFCISLIIILIFLGFIGKATFGEDEVEPGCAWTLFINIILIVISAILAVFTIRW